MTTVDFVMAAAPWLFVVSRARIAWRFTHRRITGTPTEKADWPAFSTWLFALFVGFGLTFRLVPVRAAFDSWIGVPNLGWLLAFAAESAALYVAACGCRAIPRLPIPHWAHVYAVLTLVVFLLIYGVSIGRGPERLEYVTAQTAFEVTFMANKYVFLMVMAFFIATAFIHLHRREDNELTQLRLALLAGSGLMGILYGGSRTAFVVLAFYVPACPILDALRMTQRGVMVALALIWPLSAMVSPKVCLVIRRLFERVRKPAALRDLEVIQAELSDLGLLIEPQAEAVPRGGSLDLRIYQTLISILDGKRLLARLKVADGQADVDRAKDRGIAERAESPPPAEQRAHWDARMAHRAASLRGLLESVDDEVAYFEMVAAYQAIGRQLRKT